MQRLPGDVGLTPSGPGTNPATLPESPSLFTPGRGDPAAFEVKFLLTEDIARAVEAALQPHMARDPYADPNRNGSYVTTSLYTDTPAFDVFHRNGALARRKYRIRAYGTSTMIFLERKSKRGDRVRKRRSPVPLTELAQLPAASDPDWVGAWFQRQLTLRQLVPVCRIAYERVALTGYAENQPIRATFDRDVRGVVSNTWTLDDVGSRPPLFTGQVITEFKFRVAMPALFKGLIADFGLTPCSVSKYRRFLQSTGLTSAERTPDA